MNKKAVMDIAPIVIVYLFIAAILLLAIWQIGSVALRGL
jgi:hypothetical protein